MYVARFPQPSDADCVFSTFWRGADNRPPYACLNHFIAQHLSRGLLATKIKLPAIKRGLDSLRLHAGDLLLFSLARAEYRHGPERGEGEESHGAS
jgi:hypothetical protein